MKIPPPHLFATPSRIGRGLSLAEALDNFCGHAGRQNNKPRARSPRPQAGMPLYSGRGARPSFAPTISWECLRAGVTLLVLTLLVALVFALAGCGSTVAVSGGYVTDHGDRVDGAVTVTLPEKKGLAK